MLTVQKPEKVKLLIAFIYNDADKYLSAKQYLSKKFGTIDFESEAIDFNFTQYYAPEMGGSLKRAFISFKRLQSPDAFVAIKLLCIKLERKFSRDNKRDVNIDPGYLTEAKLVLTTTKDFSHRIYIGKGLFAETTLIYQGHAFRDLPTTFPDYRTQQYKDILSKIRATYRDQLHGKR